MCEGGDDQLPVHRGQAADGAPAAERGQRQQAGDRHHRHLGHGHQVAPGPRLRPGQGQAVLQRGHGGQAALDTAGGGRAAGRLLPRHGAEDGGGDGLRVRAPAALGRLQPPRPAERGSQ